MDIMYIDESGDTIPLSQNGKNFLVLTGCIFHEKDITDIETKLRKIKHKYFQNPDVEIKSNFLRYANPDLKESSPIKLNDREKYNELEADMTAFLKDILVSKDKFSNIVERLLFATSDRTVGIQIADLYCYPLYHMFEYDKAKGEYWRFDELSSIKLSKDGGLTMFPDKTKKGLRFFS